MEQYQSNPLTYAQSQYLNHLIDPSFQGVNRLLFVLSLENENGRTSHAKYYLPKVKIKDWNIKIDGKNVFDQPIIMILKHMKILEKLALAKEMITHDWLFVRLSFFKRKL